MDTISKRIKKLRLMLNKSQLEFVSPLKDVSQAALSQIEQGGGVSAQTVAQIRKHWKADSDWLLLGIGVPFPDKKKLSDDLSFEFTLHTESIKRIGEHMKKDKPSEKMIREWGKTIYEDANKLSEIKSELTKLDKRQKK